MDLTTPDGLRKALGSAHTPPLPPQRPRLSPPDGIHMCGVADLKGASGHSSSLFHGVLPELAPSQLAVSTVATVKRRGTDMHRHATPPAEAEGHDDGIETSSGALLRGSPSQPRPSSISDSRQCVHIGPPPPLQQGDRNDPPAEVAPDRLALRRHPLHRKLMVQPHVRSSHAERTAQASDLAADGTAVAMLHEERLANSYSSFACAHPAPLPPPQQQPPVTGIITAGASQPLAADASASAAAAAAALVASLPPLHSSPLESCRQGPEMCGEQQRTPVDGEAPSSTHTVVRGYRDAVRQFAKAIARLNRMTTATCSSGTTTTMEVIAERAKVSICAGQGCEASGCSGRMPERRGDAVGSRGAFSPTASRYSGSPAKRLHAGGVYKLSTVSLQPLTFCTDGSTVLLVDWNGTARHGNYLRAVAALPGGNRSIYAPPSLSTGMVLWWKLRDLVPSCGNISLNTARASSSRAGFPNSSSRHGGSSLASVQPHRLHLPYGEPLMLLFTSTDATTSGASQVQSCEPGHDFEAGVNDGDTPSRPRMPTAAQELSQRRSRSVPVALDILRDLDHGYLPSFLESIYPDGGVRLRGCWCTVSKDARALPTASPPRHDGPSSPMAGNAWAMGCNDTHDMMEHREEDVLVTEAASPLISIRTGSSPPHEALEVDGAASNFRGVAAILRSLRPTSLPRPPTPIDATLQLPLAAWTFLGGNLAVRTAASTAVVADSFSSDVAANLRAPPATEESAVSRVFEGGDCRGFRRHISDSKDSKVFCMAPPPSNAGAGDSLTFVSPLLKAPSVPVTTLLPTSSAPSLIPPSHRCASVMVLTPVGQVHLVVPATALPLLEMSSITIHDVKYSLLRSAAGRSMRLREDEVALWYAPGTPELADAAVVNVVHAIVRLKRRGESHQ